MSHQKRIDIDAIILDLSQIETIISTTSPNEKQMFLKNFDEWATQRRNTLSKLKELKNELNDVCLKANIGKCIGTGVSVAGGVAAITGTSLELSSDEETRSTGRTLSAFGTGAVLLGGATSAGVSGVEFFVNKRILNEVKSALENDQQLTRQLVPYMNKSAELNSLFKKVFDCDILSKTATDIFTVVRGITSLCEQGKYAYENISEAFSSSVNECSLPFELENIKREFQSLGKKAQFVLQEFCENPSVRKAVLKLDQALTIFPNIWDISKISAQVFFRMSGLSKEPVYLSLIGQFACSTAKAANILMRTLSLGMDIIAFIASVRNITDSESKYSGMVEKLEFFLSKELSEAKYIVNQFQKN